MLFFLIKIPLCWAYTWLVWGSNGLKICGSFPPFFLEWLLILENVSSVLTPCNRLLRQLQPSPGEMDLDQNSTHFFINFILPQSPLIIKWDIFKMNSIVMSTTTTTKRCPGNVCAKKRESVSIFFSDQSGKVLMRKRVKPPEVLFKSQMTKQILYKPRGCTPKPYLSPYCSDRPCKTWSQNEDQILILEIPLWTGTH